MGLGEMVTGLKKFRRKMLLRLFSKKVTGQVNQVLNDCRCDWFYDFGTLLGIVRDGRLIRWDREIDVGILNADDAAVRSILEEFKGKGAKRIVVKSFREKVSNVKFDLHGVGVDLHFYQKTSDGYCCFLTVRNEGEARYGEKHRLTVRLSYGDIKLFKDVSVAGVIMRIPLNAEEVLTQKYGENWRVPDPGWKTTQSPTIEILTNEDIVTDSAAAS